MESTNFRRYIGIIFLSVLAGCAQLKTDSTQSEYINVSVGKNKVTSNDLLVSHSINVLNFVALAETGESRIVKDEQRSESNLLTAGEFYHSASGNLCRRFTKETTKYDVQQQVCNFLVACRNQAGDWYQVRQIINIDQLEKGIAKCVRH